MVCEEAFVGVEGDEFVGHEGLELGFGIVVRPGISQVVDDGCREDFAGLGDGGFLVEGEFVEAGEEGEDVGGGVEGGWGGHGAWW